MPFRERLGPRVGKDPIGVGNVLGKVIEPDEVLWLETDSDQYDSWSYGVMVTGQDTAEKVLAFGATGVVEINNSGEKCDFAPVNVVADVIERYHGAQINGSSVRGRIRWIPN